MPPSDPRTRFNVNAVDIRLLGGRELDPVQVSRERRSWRSRRQASGREKPTTVQLPSRARPDIRYVARVPTTRIMHLDLAVGTRLPAYPTSMGRVLLGALPDGELASLISDVTPCQFTDATVTDPGALTAAIRSAGQDGYALVDQELEEGLRSLAVPVHDGRGRVAAAAVNIALHAGRGTPDEAVATLLPPLRDAAAAIADDVATVRRWSTNSAS